MNAELPIVFIIEAEHSTSASLGVMLGTERFETESYGSAEEFLNNFDPGRLLLNRQGCVLMDVLLPGMSGLELQVNLNEKHIDLPVVFLTGVKDIPKCVQAMKEGAVDVLEIPCQKIRLLDSIAEALARHEQALQSKSIRKKLEKRLARLTRREREILTQLTSGEPDLSSEKIAERLFISRRTVEHHRAAIKEKMGAHSLLELVDMARICNFGL